MSKYGNIRGLILDTSRSINTRKWSIWWKDIRICMGMCCRDSNWFVNSVSCKLGDGLSINFWRNKWLEEEPLLLQFFSIFVCLHVNRIKIFNVGFLNDDNWCWIIHVIPITLSIAAALE